MEQAFRLSITEARGTGPTRLPVPHVLSEVEALWDRVAILRAGHLVETGTLAEMGHLSALSVEAEFGAAPPEATATALFSGRDLAGAWLP